MSEGKLVSSGGGASCNLSDQRTLLDHRLDVPNGFFVEPKVLVWPERAHLNLRLASHVVQKGDAALFDEAVCEGSREIIRGERGM